MIEAHIKRELIRVIEKVIKYKPPKMIDPDFLRPGTNVLIYYRSSKQNEQNE